MLQDLARAVGIGSFFCMFPLLWNVLSNQSDQIAKTTQSEPLKLAHVIDALAHHPAELLVAVFTLFLFVATRQLVAATADVARMSVEAARESSRYLRAAEAAHITGGYGGSLDRAFVYANLNNYGKTQGFVTRIAVAVAPLDGLPDQPQYPEGIEPGFVLAPNHHRFEVPDARAPWDHVSEGQVFYGRVWYTDTFDDNEHFSSFILQLPSGRGVPRPRYWERGSAPARRWNGSSCSSSACNSW